MIYYLELLMLKTLMFNTIFKFKFIQDILGYYLQALRPDNNMQIANY